MIGDWNNGIPAVASPASSRVFCSQGSEQDYCVSHGCTFSSTLVAVETPSADRSNPWL